MFCSGSIKRACNATLVEILEILIFFRCFYIAQSYQLLKKWIEALCLYDLVIKYASEAREKLKASNNALFNVSMQIRNVGVIVGYSFQPLYLDFSGSAALSFSE